MVKSAAQWVVLTAVVIAGLTSTARGQLYRGDSCKLSDGRSGECRPVEQCEDAKKEISQGKRPTLCGYDKSTPIACCPGTSESKAQKMCRKYGEYVFELIRKPTFIITSQPQFDNRSRCVGDGKTFIIGGEEAKPKEFPHMALVGYGEKRDISWWCGGSLISLRFVMTAGHCLQKTAKGEPRWVRVGELNIKLTTESAQPQDLAIVQKFPHKDYTPPSHYNDIALLKLEKDVEITDYVRPACLGTLANIPVSEVVASGWGRIDWADSEGSDSLMKVSLSVLPTEDCSKFFDSLKGTRRLEHGILGSSMVCAGEKGNKDTCRGDSGGPLQYIMDTPYCMYNVVGVTSFGSTVCGSINSSGVYSRVSHFVPWIESIVWPDV